MKEIISKIEESQQLIFDRIDSRIEESQKNILDRVDQKIDTKIGSLRQDLLNKFDDQAILIKEKFNEVDQRLDSLEKGQEEIKLLSHRTGILEMRVHNLETA